MEYSYYPGLDNPHAVGIGDTVYFAHQDGFGNVIGLVSDSKHLRATYDYTLWGEGDGSLENLQGKTNRARFKGALWMGEEGPELYYMRARWYEPQCGRFLSEDPIGLAGGLNLYSFAHNNPINGSDPTGECGILGIAGGALIGLGLYVGKSIWTDKQMTLVGGVTAAGLGMASGFVSCGLLAVVTNPGWTAGNVALAQLNLGAAVGGVFGAGDALVIAMNAKLDRGHRSGGGLRDDDGLPRGVPELPGLTTVTTGRSEQVCHWVGMRVGVYEGLGGDGVIEVWVFTNMCTGEERFEWEVVD